MRWILLTEPCGRLAVCVGSGGASFSLSWPRAVGSGAAAALGTSSVAASSTVANTRSPSNSCARIGWMDKDMEMLLRDSALSEHGCSVRLIESHADAAQRLVEAHQWLPPDGFRDPRDVGSTVAHVLEAGTIRLVVRNEPQTFLEGNFVRGFAQIFGNDA